ncbi:MAG: hypothetical protein H6618_03175 [Deltaproteobacteria bacterium]|nr:hypothetical protein [Deltaproteobacteria bacterium]
MVVIIGFGRQSVCFRFVCALLFSFLIMTETVRAELTVHVGPVSPGGGGSNPISLPPINLQEYELVWLTDQHREWSVSLVPGLFYGHRYVMKQGGYVSMGAGLAVSFHGVGPGVYAAFGYTGCSWFCFNIEYKKALGVLPGMLIQPYAIRMGVVLFRN